MTEELLSGSGWHSDAPFSSSSTHISPGEGWRGGGEGGEGEGGRGGGRGGGVEGKGEGGGGRGGGVEEAQFCMIDSAV